MFCLNRLNLVIVDNDKIINCGVNGHIWRWDVVQGPILICFFSLMCNVCLSGYRCWEIQHCLQICPGSLWPQHQSYNRVSSEQHVILLVENTSHIIIYILLLFDSKTSWGQKSTQELGSCLKTCLSSGTIRKMKSSFSAFILKPLVYVF